MHWHYTPYALPYAVTSIVSAIAAIMGWRRRHMAGAAPLVLFTLALIEWSIGNALELCSVDLASKAFWVNIQYLGIVATPMAWFAFGLQFAGRGAWLSRRNTALLSIIPPITIVLIWTDSYHHLMRYNIRLDTSGPFSVIIKTYGPWLWAHAAYTYILLFIGTYSVIRAFSRQARFFRWQAGILMTAILIPWIVNFLYIFHMVPSPFPDITPMAFAVSGIAVVVGMLRYQLLGVMPVARAAVVGSMNSAVFVLDSQDRIVDLNAAAQRMVGWNSSRAIGRRSAEVLSAWPDLTKSYDIAKARSGFSVNAGGEARFYEALFSTLRDHRGRLIGRLIISNDITERKRAQSLIVQQHRALALMQERERLARELHDNLGQILGYLSMQAQTIRGALAGGQPIGVESHLVRLADVIKDTHEELSSFVRNMKDDTVLQQGFFSASEQLLERFKKRYGIHVELEIPDELKGNALDSNIEIQLLGIIQEALTNVRKHSGVDSARVVFEVDANEVRAIIEDNGRGFDAVALGRSEGGGLGLSIMRERAREAGCDLRIESAPGQGTKVCIMIPLARKPDQHIEVTS